MVEGLASGAVTGVVGAVVPPPSVSLLQEAVTTARHVYTHLSPAAAAEVQLATAVLDMRVAVSAGEWTKAGTVASSVCMMVRQHPPVGQSSGCSSSATHYVSRFP